MDSADLDIPGISCGNVLDAYGRVIHAQGLASAARAPICAAQATLNGPRQGKRKMNTPLSIMAEANHTGFFALVILGGLAGWIAGMITGMKHGIMTNVLVGIAGSWVAAELANVAGVIVRGTVGHLVAAVVGAIVVTFVWQMLRGRQQA